VTVAVVASLEVVIPEEAVSPEVVVFRWLA